MRLVRFLLVFVLVIAGSVFAQDSKTNDQKPGAQKNNEKPIPPADSAKPLNPLQDGQTFTLDGKTFHLDKKMLRLVPEVNASDLTNDCLVMHTIQVARDDKDSDSTHVVNVTNCTPAKRFQMKSAVAVPQQR